MLAVALVLLGLGAREIWRPLAYLAPACVLLWIALPSRAPFIARPVPRERGKDK